MNDHGAPSRLCPGPRRRAALASRAARRRAAGVRARRKRLANPQRAACGAQKAAARARECFLRFSRAGPRGGTHPQGLRVTRRRAKKPFWQDHTRAAVHKSWQPGEPEAASWVRDFFRPRALGCCPPGGELWNAAPHRLRGRQRGSSAFSCVSGCVPMPMPAPKFELGTRSRATRD